MERVGLVCSNPHWNSMLWPKLRIHLHHSTSGLDRVAAWLAPSSMPV